MRFRKAAWITLCACGAIMLLFQCMGPVTSSDPNFGFILLAGAVAMILGSVVGAYLLLSYLVQWASKA
jgi:hypothetical protein